MWIETDFDYQLLQKQAKPNVYQHPYFSKVQSCMCGLCGKVKQLQVYNLMPVQVLSWKNRWYQLKENVHWCDDCLNNFRQNPCKHKPRCKKMVLYGYGLSLHVCKAPEDAIIQVMESWREYNKLLEGKIAKLQKNVNKHLDKILAFNLELEKRQESIAVEEKSG